MLLISMIREEHGHQHVDRASRSDINNNNIIILKLHTVANTPPRETTASAPTNREM